HVSYAFVPLGFLLIALSIVRADVMAASAAQHAWTAGAIGMMTLAVMTRASLGHTGQRLATSTPITLIFVAAFLGAVARVAAGIPGLRDQALATGAVLWVAAFAGFVAVFAPLLMKRRAP
ncbi:MAG: NnrS family protein, partial [Hyphomicrobiaceae bacterium]|nr:NnrS family protein [Hyphomicrobiaceae bacterium]